MPPLRTPLVFLQRPSAPHRCPLLPHHAPRLRDPASWGTQTKLGLGKGQSEEDPHRRFWPFFEARFGFRQKIPSSYTLYPKADSIAWSFAISKAAVRPNEPALSRRHVWHSEQRCVEQLGRKRGPADLYAALEFTKHHTDAGMNESALFIRCVPWARVGSSIDPPRCRQLHLARGAQARGGGVRFQLAWLAIATSAELLSWSGRRPTAASSPGLTSRHSRRRPFFTSPRYYAATWRGTSSRP